MPGASFRDKMDRLVKRRPARFYLLSFLLLFLAVGGLAGGIALTADPSGGLLKIPLSFLEDTPFKNYLLPGLFLLVVLGVYPLMIFYGMLARPEWKWANALNLYKEQHWSNTHALYVGIILILWIDLQVMFVGYGHFIQTLYALLGVAITVLALLPSVKKYFTQP
ncbi:MAG: hypothetical protein AB1500_01645 [Bacillota bacterium]